jgi:hypothetical protein
MQDHGIPTKEEMEQQQKDAQEYTAPDSIYDLHMHEAITVCGPKGSYPNQTYSVTRVHGGWLYQLHTGTITVIPPVFVPRS